MGGKGRGNKGKKPIRGQPVRGRGDHNRDFSTSGYAYQHDRHRSPNKDRYARSHHRETSLEREVRLLSEKVARSVSKCSYRSRSPDYSRSSSRRHSRSPYRHSRSPRQNSRSPHRHSRMSPGRYSEYHCPKSPRRRDWFEHDTRSSSWQSRSSRQTHDFTESHHSQDLKPTKPQTRQTQEFTRPRPYSFRGTRGSERGRRGGQGQGRGQSKGPFDGKPIKTPEEMRKLQTLPNTRVSYFVHGGKSENAEQFQTFDEASRVAQNSERQVSARVLHIPKGSTNKEPRTADLIDLTSDLTRETTNTEKKPKVVGPTKERPISNRKPILKPEHVPKKAKTPLRLPIWKYDLETWKNFFTVEENKDLTRAFVHPDMPAADITNFFADIREFGFVVIHTDSNCKNTLSLCSPSGIVLIFHDDQPLKLPTQVMSILYTEHDVIMYKEAVLFSRDYKLPKPEVHELYLYYKTIFTDVKSGPAKYLRSQLGQECPLTFFDPYDRRCVQFMTLGARAIAYGLWTIAAQLAERSGLGKGANISHFMRLALLTTNGFEPENNMLSYRQKC